MIYAGFAPARQNNADRLPCEESVSGSVRTMCLRRFIFRLRDYATDATFVKRTDKQIW